MAKFCAMISVAAALSLFACRSYAGDCVSTADFPLIDLVASSDSFRTLAPYSITATVERYYDAPLGLGFLEVQDERDQHYYDWMFELNLPLWSAPDPNSRLGWLAGGRVYADSGTHLLTGAGMVETEYEHTSFIVWDVQGDWLKLQLTGGLSAWTHKCHLNKARFRPTFVPWNKFFRRHGDWLHFRKPVPHVLRSSADLKSDRVTMIGRDHKLTLLNIQGDWMEVEVEQPDLTCRGSDRDELPSTKARGWVKWRDEQGPWVYIYTRGC